MVKGLTYRLRVLLCGWLPKWEGKKERKREKKENNNNKILLYFVENMLCGVKVLKSSSTYIKVSNNANENFTV